MFVDIEVRECKIFNGSLKITVYNKGAFDLSGLIDIIPKNAYKTIYIFAKEIPNSIKIVIKDCPTIIKECKIQQ
ncbi:MAG: hypothetical protein QXL82_00675 [Candidatus Aenigmatarchaeota archaeon]